jgi:hypothetical protein
MSHPSLLEIKNFGIFLFQMGEAGSYIKRAEIAFRMILYMLTGLAAGIPVMGQSVPSKPLSIPVYHQMILNPAFVGSKDYTSIAFTSKAFRNPDSQVLHLHKRLASSTGEFSNLGAGAYLFQEQLSESWNTGLALTGSYHFYLDDEKLHVIAAGVTAKGFFLVPKKDSESVPDSAGMVFRPNMDLGVYYYSPRAFAGLSSTTLFGTGVRDSTMLYSYMDREYHLLGGFKFVIYEELGIVIEPSLQLSVNDQTIKEPHKHLIPYLKVYLQNFYLGTYLKDFDTFALYFEYQFPKFYAGAFLEFPRVGYLNDDNIIFEVSLGINIGKNTPSFLHYRHW